MQNKSIEMIEYYRLLQDEMLDRKRCLTSYLTPNSVTQKAYSVKILCDEWRAAFYPMT